MRIFLGSCCFLLAISCGLNLNFAQPADEMKKFEQLFDNWAKWAKSIDDIQPLHTISESSSTVNWVDLGFGGIIRDEYSFRPALFACTSDHQNPLTQDPTKQYLQLAWFHRNDIQGEHNKVSLQKTDPAAGWYIERTSTYNRFHRFLDVVNYIPAGGKTTSPTELYDVSFVPEASGPQVDVYRCVVKNPVLEGFGGAGHSKVNSFVIHFDQQHNGLPTRIDFFCFLDFNASLTFSDWKPVLGIEIPHRVVHRLASQTAEEPPYKQTDFRLIEQCSLEEVDKRCRTEFYDLPPMPEIPKAASTFAWWYLLIGAGVCLIGWIVFRRFSGK